MRNKAGKMRAVWIEFSWNNPQHGYLLLARITICNATITAIDATIGNSSEFSCRDAVSMSFTEFDIEVTLESMFLLAESNEEPNPAISDFNLFSSFDVSLIPEFNSITCFDSPPMSCLRTTVAAEP